MAQVVQRDAKVLAAGYSRGFRAVEIGSIAAFVSLQCLLAYRLLPFIVDAPLLFLSMVALGFISADFVSGLVHWLADTWGSPDMPILGKALLRPFREHHVDPKAMTRHDFVETNGANCLISLPLGAAVLLVPLTPGEGFWFRGALVAYVAVLLLWVMLTNQIHKWSHEAPEVRPRIVGWLQRRHVILWPEHHDIHHTAPFDKYYCITAGWLNPVLTRMGFFRRLERLITRWTGAVPRRDDIGLAAALQTVSRGSPSEAT